MPVGIGFGSFFVRPSPVAWVPYEVVESSGTAALPLPAFDYSRRSFSAASGSGTRTLAVKTVSSRARSHEDDAPSLEIAQIPPSRMLLLC